jgi:hypothetical protein
MLPRSQQAGNRRSSRLAPGRIASDWGKHWGCDGFARRVLAGTVALPTP